MDPSLEGSITFSSFIILVSYFLGITISCFLLFIRAKKNKANIFLGCIVLIFTLSLSASFLYLCGLLKDYPHIIKVYVMGTFMLGPFIYFYVRSCTQKGFRMVPKMWLHFIPAVLDIIYHIPFYLLSGEEKYTFFLSFQQTGDLGDPLILPATKAIHSLVYFFISARIVLKYKDHLTNATSHIDSSFHRWLLVFSSVLLIPILSIGLFVFTNLNIIPFTFIAFCEFLFFMFVYASLLLKPAIFHSFPFQMLIPDSTEEKTQKYENSNLQETQKEKYVKKLIAYVEKQKTYREPELTLSKLAEEVEIPSHYLSQVINEKIKCTFLDFINTYRIKEAKEKLIDEAFNHYTIIAIAHEAGFNSKSAFYSAFKKHTGTTPSSFRKSGIFS